MDLLGELSVRIVEIVENEWIRRDIVTLKQKSVIGIEQEKKEQ